MKIMTNGKCKRLFILTLLLTYTIFSVLNVMKNVSSALKYTMLG